MSLATNPQTRIPIDVTEAELLAYLQAKAASYGIPGLKLTIYERCYKDGGLGLLAETDQTSSETIGGSTFEEVIDKISGRVDPKRIIAEKRELAAKFSREADLLEAKISP